MVDDRWWFGIDMRRAALILVVLFIAPLSSAWPIPDFPLIESEWVVVENDGWTSEEWVDLRNQGLEPLRQISETEVIVWGSFGDYQLKEEMVLRGPIADGYRVILEPRLPSIAQWDILDLFEFQNLILAGHSSAYPTTFEVFGMGSEIFDSIPGIWWVEPILKTESRSNVAADIMLELSNSSYESEKFNGSGVIVGMADSGIELDHECFRENQTAIGDIGINHRKVIRVNSSIDDGDHPGHEDFRHGTHLAGALICDLFSGIEGRGIAHSSQLIFQDVVNESGWSEPEMDWLLAEDLAYGAVIHSYSWGDVTEAYTSRSFLLDAWHREIPWSLAFIAPGNNPNKLYEPANARNIVSVGGTLKDNGTDLFTGSSYGPTEEGLRGNFIVTPAVGIVSAAADGNLSSFNNDMRSSTGTSSSTALGAGVTAIIQQMVQEGYFIQNGNFTPSGSQLRVLLAMSAQSLEGGEQGGEYVGAAPNTMQGWGRPSLDNIAQEDVWIHDSYQMNESQRLEMIVDWLDNNGSKPFESIEKKMWNGSGAQGPFLKNGESVEWNLTLKNNTDFGAFLSFDQRPFGQSSDDLNLVVTLPNGTQFETNDSLEGTEGLKIDIDELGGVEWVSVEVIAKNVGIGNYTDLLGNDGDKVGFALAISGVEGIKIDLPLDNDELCCQNTIEDKDSLLDPNVTNDPAPVFEKGEWGGDKGEIYDKTNDEGKAWYLDSKLFWNYGIVCLVLILILVMGVAVTSYSLDKKKKKKEIDEQMSISKEKLEK